MLIILLFNEMSLSGPQHCLKLKCSECLLNEVDSHYCPMCLENMSSSEAKLKKNRCGNCFDCPSCGHTLTTRATNVAISDPDDPGKSTPKKMYYMACGFCRWTTRDVAIDDKTVASGGWEDIENTHAKKIQSLLDYYHELALNEKAERERKKYVRRRSHLYYAASMDKYGMVTVAVKKKIGAMSNVSIKENEETTTQITTEEKISDFPALPDDFFTTPLELSKVTTITQRLASPEFQPTITNDLYPKRKHLLIRKSMRCKECEHNLIKPEMNPLSIKFKIQLVIMHHIPEVRLMAPMEFRFKKELKVVLLLINPVVHNTTVSLLPVDKESDSFSTAKIELPKKEVVLARRDDAAIYDDATQMHQEFKDEKNVVAFRKANKLGVIIKVTPLIQEGDVKVSFVLRHDYRNTAVVLPMENQEPQISWLQHRIFLNLGRIHKSK
ncbi:hypothetical protein ScPMuIL_004611 [Solemya velum]